jgi:cytochrome P450
MTQIESSRSTPISGTCPVRNFNYTLSKPAGTWFAEYDNLREETPLYRNEFGPGYLTIANYEGILEVFQNSEDFSNRAVTVMDPDPQYKWIPLMIDGDEHLQWRRQLGPLFSPKAIEKLETKVRGRAIELIEEIQATGRGEVDFMVEFAQRYPTSIFLELLGLPVAELPQFMEWEHEILHSGETDISRREERRRVAMQAVMKRFESVIAERRAKPEDDIISKSLTFQVDGQPVSDEDLLSFCLLMFMAGLDTVSATLGWSFNYLATHPEERARIVEDPDLIPDAIEEFLRVYAIVQTGRKVVRDTEIQGCPVKAGSMVGLPINAATRDEVAFPDATNVDIARTPNNHIAFGAGQHRCLGSHLARRELKIALEEWHKRIPEYRLAPDAELFETGGQLGLISLPLQWDPS